MKQFICLFAILALLSILLPASAEGSDEIPVSGITFAPGWETRDNHRVFYEIFVASFSDSDGDGTGDLRGIINRMDYLNDGDPQSGKSLGVEGIWLTPVFTSPSYHKYDVTDYYQIDPAFGTTEDLRELIALCHERGVKLILDLPLNHTGSRNAWYGNFKNAHRKNNPSDPWYDFYCWSPSADADPSGRRFIDTGAGVRVEANFSDSMPELNFDSEQVRETVLDVARYWMELGVDGFRFDAAKYVFLGEHERNAAFWTWYTGELRKINPEVYTVAEVWDGDAILDWYTPCMNCFRFSWSQAEGLLAKTANNGNVTKFARSAQQAQASLRSLNPEAMLIPFLSNHDMDRSGGFLSVSRGNMAMAASVYLLLPGSPFIYYGEEIGLRGSRGGSDTDANRRLKMRWGDDDPVQDPPGADYTKQTTDTVLSMLPDENSLLNHYKRVLLVRRANPEIARGAIEALTFEEGKAGGFLCSWNGSTVAVLHNPTTRGVTLDLSAVTDLPFSRIAAELKALPGKGGAELDGTVLSLGPLTSVVLRMD